MIIDLSNAHLPEYVPVGTLIPGDGFFYNNKVWMVISNLPDQNNRAGVVNMTDIGVDGLDVAVEVVKLALTLQVADAPIVR